MMHNLSAKARGSVKAAAIVACAAGVGVWGAILLAPAPHTLPAALAAASIQGTDPAPVAGWFGAGAAPRVKISSSGLIAAGAYGSAILSVDGARPRAYGVGQELAQDLILAEVHPSGVVIRQGGQELEVSVPSLPPVSGISLVSGASN